MDNAASCTTFAAVCRVGLAMGWGELYVHLKPLHIGLVLCSGGLFASRGLAALLGAVWPMAAPVRYASYVLDTCLLLAGLSLWWMLGLNPLRELWLGTKLGLLLCYIVLGSLALKRARRRPLRWACWLAALVCYAFMLSVARYHHPLGWWAPIGG